MTCTSGPVPLSAEEYVERWFERETLTYLLKREWVLLLGPRQHGKTSALLRLKRTLSSSGYRCAFVDLQALPPQYTFSELLEWFASSIARELGSRIASRPHGRAESLEEWLEAAVPCDGPPVVILVDEASAVADEGMRNGLYGQIRALKALAAANPQSVAALLVFLFAGTFRPESMVDPRNSPFNVCRRIETEDLDLRGVVALARIALRRDGVDEIALAVFDAVGGQPHLVQSLLALCAAHEEASQLSATASEVERWKQNSNDHVDAIFRALFRDVGLVQIASAAVAQGAVTIDPANPDFKYVCTLGLMKRDGANLVYRNTLFEAIARASPQLRPEQAVAPTVTAHFYPLGMGAFGHVADAEYREIACAAHDGAIAAAKAGNYRLALVGFGVALEAILIDVLTRLNQAEIAQLVNAAKGDAAPSFSRYEDSTDPHSWRLVNLMKVVRLVKKFRGPTEVPNALREMRNFVHPALIKRAYCPEGELKPEAIAAAGLLGIVMRDVQRV
jgi:hypothetical protein